MSSSADGAGRYDMPDLDVGEPPPGMSYPDAQDLRFEAILARNGVAASEAELIEALGATTAIMQAAVAHVLGRRASTRAVPFLSRLLSDRDDDTVRVEAAFALARMGVRKGRDVLIELLGYPLNAYVSPAPAAGYLARLDDPRGFDVVVEGLGLDIAAVRMIACKQLYFFVPFHGRATAPGPTIDVYGAFATALTDPDPTTRWQALVQLHDLRAPESRVALREFMQATSDPVLLRLANATLVAIDG
jgi:HEAT repeat protein